MPIQRLVPILLLDNDQQVVKTITFKDRTYIGDPLVAVRLFNDLGADELMILSIGDGSYQNGSPPWDVLEQIAGEALMPLSYGGCIGGVADAVRVISLGYEKIIFSASRLYDDTDLTKVVDEIGSQSVSICINYTESLLTGRVVRCHKTRKKLGRLSDVTATAASIGVGEITLQSMSREGTRKGLDLKVIMEISDAFIGPVLLSGGFSGLDEISDTIRPYISGVAGGSFFVFSGRRRGVLISYPGDSERNI